MITAQQRDAACQGKFFFRKTLKKCKKKFITLENLCVAFGLIYTKNTKYSRILTVTCIVNIDGSEQCKTAILNRYGTMLFPKMSTYCSQYVLPYKRETHAL